MPDGIGQYGGANTAAKYSGSIWGDCPVEAIRRGLVPGFVQEITFTKSNITPPTTEGNYNDYAFFSSTGGTATGDTTEVGGGLAIGSDGDNEGASLRTVVVPAKIILTGGDFWMEWRMLTSTITDAKHNIFSGLWENVALDATHPITAAGALSDNNFIGFHRPESAKAGAGTGGATLNAVYKTDGNTQVTTNDVGTLVAATYTNLGFKFVPKRRYGKGAGAFYWYQDGAVVNSYVVTSTAGNPFPNDVQLGFVFAVLNATASTPGTSTVKNMRMAQLAGPLP